MSFDLPDPSALFAPTRAAALQRLQAFLPRAGADYARHRNSDYGPTRRDNVSMLSPYLRYRMLGERETVAAVLAAHGYEAAEKFIQEVLWRSYWKGWLQLRPAVWTRYLRSLDEARTQAASNSGLQQALAAAEAGRSGIEGFDDWARELVQTGYLHNHTRMWFASIWIFTLRLPWALGADFFLRHLLDADPASNTLSWRWVAGLQTVGKTYAATADNIARCTDGRFNPRGLATHCEPLSEPPLPKAGELAQLAGYATDTASLLLVHAEDLNPLAALPTGLPLRAAAVIGADAPGIDAPDADARAAAWPWGEKAQQFLGAARADACARLQAEGLDIAPLATLDVETITCAARGCGAQQVLCMEAPVGPLADRLDTLAAELERSGLPLRRLRNPWDARFWPQARRGFFPFKAGIVDGLGAEGVAGA